jgi:hypothetical protein
MYTNSLSCLILSGILLQGCINNSGGSFINSTESTSDSTSDSSINEASNDAIKTELPSQEANLKQANVSIDEDYFSRRTLDISDVNIISSLEQVTLSSNLAKIKTLGMVYAEKDGNFLYSGYVSESGDIKLNAYETATSIILQVYKSLNITDSQVPMFRSKVSTLDGFKELKNKIESSITKNGYITSDDIKTEVSYIIDGMLNNNNQNRRGNVITSGTKKHTGYAYLDFIGSSENTVDVIFYSRHPLWMELYLSDIKDHSTKSLTSSSYAIHPMGVKDFSDQFLTSDPFKLLSLANDHIKIPYQSISNVIDGKDWLEPFTTSKTNSYPTKITNLNINNEYGAFILDPSSKKAITLSFLQSALLAVDITTTTLKMEVLNDLVGDIAKIHQYNIYYENKDFKSMAEYIFQYMIDKLLDKSTNVFKTLVETCLIEHGKKITLAPIEKAIKYAKITASFVGIAEIALSNSQNPQKIIIPFKLPATKITPKPGTYNNGISVTFAEPVNVNYDNQLLYYTLDGSIPNITIGSDRIEGNGAILYDSNHITLDESAIIKAITVTYDANAINNIVKSDVVSFVYNIEASLGNYKGSCMINNSSSNALDRCYNVPNEPDYEDYSCPNIAIINENQCPSQNLLGRCTDVTVYIGNQDMYYYRTGGTLENAKDNCEAFWGGKFISVSEEQTTSISGNWSGAWTDDEFGFYGDISANLTQNGDSISGSVDVSGTDNQDCPIDGAFTGNLNGSNLTFGIADNSNTVTYSGTVNSSTSMGGTWEITQHSNTICKGITGTWNLTK